VVAYTGVTIGSRAVAREFAYVWALAASVSSRIGMAAFGVNVVICFP